MIATERIACSDDEDGREVARCDRLCRGSRAVTFWMAGVE